MIINRLGKMLALAAAIFFIHIVAGGNCVAQTKENFTIALSPCTDVVMSFKKFQPLVKYLEDETGFKIKLVLPQDPAQLERGILAGEIDFVLQDPNVYVKFAHLYHQDSLLKTLNQKGGESQAAVIIVRKDDTINHLHDLKGKTVLFGPKFFASRWLAARLLFEEHGMDIDRDLKSYSHGTCCENVAFSVYLKAVDAGVVCDHFIEEHSKRQKELGVDARKIRPISSTRPVPTRVFAAPLSTVKESGAKVNRALDAKAMVKS